MPSTRLRTPTLEERFFADADTHDLILTGEERGSTWVAVISIIDLCNVIKSLPDARTQQ